MPFGDSGGSHLTVMLELDITSMTTLLTSEGAISYTRKAIIMKRKLEQVSF